MTTPPKNRSTQATRLPLRDLEDRPMKRFLAMVREHPLQRSSLAILAFGACLIALLWTAVVIKVRAEKEADTRDAIRHSANLARAVQEQALRTLREADQVLMLIVQQYQERGRKLDLRWLKHEGPIVSRIYNYFSIIDERGDLIMGSEPFRPMNLADREHFRVHIAQSVADQPYISGPVLGRASGKWSIQLSRRIDKPGGSFGGVAVVSIDPLHFTQFYRQLDLGERGMATLVGRDGIVRAHRARDQTASLDTSKWSIFDRLKTSDSGSYLAVNSDGVRRLFSYRVLADYPLVAVVSFAEDDVLAEFRERARNYYLGAALISCLTLLFTASLMRMTSRQAGMATDLRRQNIELLSAERSVRASEYQIRLVADNVPVMLARWDRELRCRWANALYAAYYGMAPEAVAGRTMGELVGEDHLKTIRPHIEKVLAGETVRYETTPPRWDGAVRILYSEMVPDRGADGTVQGWFGVLRDVTDERRAERDLRASEVRFAAMFHESPAPMSLIDANTRRYLAVNRAWMDLLGYTRPQVIGRTSLEFRLFDKPADRERLYLERIGGAAIDGYEAVLRRADGSRRTCLLSGRMLDMSGAPAILRSIVDVTEQRRAQQALQASEARFSAMFQNSPAPLLLVAAADGRFQDVNRAFAEMLGYPRERLIGRTSAELNLYVQPPDRDGLYARLARDGIVDRHEIRVRRADGEVRTLLTSGHAIEVNGVRSCLWSTADVTEQRRAERQMQEMNETLERAVEARTAQLRQANAELHSAMDHLKSTQGMLVQSEKLAALGRLVAGVAHELNTPIGNSLLSASTLAEHTEAFAAQSAGDLRRSTLDAFISRAREGSAILLRNLERAAHLIQSFKQVSADQTSSQRRTFDLQKLVDEVLLTYRPMLKRTAIEARSDVAQGIELDSYPGPLGQVVGNLLANAVLHGYEDRSRGTVTVSARTDGDLLVELAVRDDGRGIPEADLRRVFDPFFTTRMGRGGTGLGLPICHSIVTDTLGGTIRIASRPGEGTRVIVRIPLIAPSVDSDASEKHAA
ncbi:MAG TPA: PAS domain S-box protein [Burkholderiales bacterium]|nr:PAS domain S-box protein [Burkholderiales bacterium]